jgi:hypothetical protein
MLAEQRRREQAAREARARHLAFERGLRTETVENMMRDNTEGEDPVYSAGRLLLRWAGMRVRSLLWKPRPARC